MQAITLYHHPQCSKSRKALEILQSLPINLTVIDYLKTPLSLAQLEDFTKQIHFSELIRTNEKAFKDFHCAVDNAKQALDILQQEPNLMQRPIASNGQQTLIARPPERVLELIDKTI